MAKIHRFIGNFDLTKKELKITGETAKQIALVLKLKIGEKIELCDNQGISALVEISKINKNDIDVLIKEKMDNKKIPDNNVILFCAVLKKENFELVVQKATECGASKIIPIISARTVKTGLNIERLRKIAHEASEQSDRNTVPEISEPIKFIDAIKNLEGKKFLFDSSGSPLNSSAIKIEKINIFIGPEGGWTPEEITLVRENNFHIASLGHLTLRGETAAIIATYLISNLR